MDFFFVRNLEPMCEFCRSPLHFTVILAAALVKTFKEYVQHTQTQAYTHTDS